MQEEIFFSIVSIEIFDSANPHHKNHIHFENGGKLNYEKISNESVMIISGQCKKGFFIYRYKHNVHSRLNIINFISKFKEYYTNIKLDGTTSTLPIIIKNNEEESFTSAITKILL